jgi:hypothetical protein
MKVPGQWGTQTSLLRCLHGAENVYHQWAGWVCILCSLTTEDTMCGSPSSVLVTVVLHTPSPEHGAPLVLQLIPITKTMQCSHYCLAP